MKQMTNNNKYACNYAVLSFQPYPETGEFVNLGVVAHCPSTADFGVHVETKRMKRVTNFFPELDRKAFKSARTAIVEELERVRKLVEAEKNLELGRLVFKELVRRRESVFRFGEIRTILTDQPKKLAACLFDQYVNRQFTKQKEYQEVVMANRYYEALRKQRPNQIFRKSAIVGTDCYHVRIPITSELVGANGAPLRAIKPLNLNREEPTAVVEHGDAWIQRLRRLREVDSVPERAIFAIIQPQQKACMDAALRIADELRAENAVVIGSEETERLVELAE